MILTHQPLQGLRSIRRFPLGSSAILHLQLSWSSTNRSHHLHPVLFIRCLCRDCQQRSFRSNRAHPNSTSNATSRPYTPLHRPARLHPQDHRSRWRIAWLIPRRSRNLAARGTSIRGLVLRIRMDDERRRRPQWSPKRPNQPMESRCIRRSSGRGVVVGQLSAWCRQEQNADRRVWRYDEISQYAGLFRSDVASGGHPRVLERDWTNADASVAG